MLWTSLEQMEWFYWEMLGASISAKLSFTHCWKS